MTHKNGDAPASTPNKLCPNCENLFVRKRSDQIFCTPTCRKSLHQKKAREATPQNSASSPTKRRVNLVFFDKALRLAELIYTAPISERLGLMQSIVASARGGNSELRQILTNKLLRYPDRSRVWLFHNRCPSSFLTISEAANNYCKKFWNADVRDVVYGHTPEPESGEVSTKPSSPSIYTPVNTKSSGSAGDYFSRLVNNNSKGPFFLKSVSETPYPPILPA